MYRRKQRNQKRLDLKLFFSLLLTIIHYVYDQHTEENGLKTER